VAEGVGLTGLVAEGVVADTAGELLAPLGPVLVAGAFVAGPVVLADGDGDGLCEAGAPVTPPLKEVPWPGTPWTTADSGLPAACSSRVSGTAQPMNAATMNAAGPAQRRRRRDPSCEAAAACATSASSSG
jgi:hypothetical protein